jgi:hypothetical protein
MKSTAYKLFDMMMQIVGLILALIFILYLYRGSSFAWQLEGVVIDSVTGNPVPNAIVVSSLPARSGFIFNVGEDDVAIHETLTNAKGEFHVPFWGPRLYFSKYVLAGEPQILVARDNYEPLIIHGLHREKINSLHGEYLSNMPNDYLRLRLKKAINLTSDSYSMHSLVGSTGTFNMRGTNNCWELKLLLLSGYLIKNNLMSQRYIDDLTANYCAN